MQRSNDSLSECALCRQSGTLRPGHQVMAGAKRTRGVAFGSGAADEDDSYGMMEDYVVEETDKRKGLLFAA